MYFILKNISWLNTKLYLKESIHKQMRNNMLLIILILNLNKNKKNYQNKKKSISKINTFSQFSKFIKNKTILINTLNLIFLINLCNIFFIKETLTTIFQCLDSIHILLNHKKSTFSFTLCLTLIQLTMFIFIHIDNLMWDLLILKDLKL